MTIQPYDLTEITLLGAPVIHPLRSECILLAKTRMDEVSDSYKSVLVQINSDSGKETELVLAVNGSPVTGHSPKWSPDGSSISFLRNAKGKDELWLYNCETQTERCLTPSIKVKEYVWSPDQERIAFISRVQQLDEVCYAVNRLRYKLDGEGMTIGYNQLFTVEVQSGELEQRTTFESDHGCPVFCDNGKQVAYVVYFPDGNDLFKKPEIQIQQLDNRVLTSWNPGAKEISAFLPAGQGAFYGVGKERVENSVEYDRLFYVTVGEPLEWFNWDIDVPIGFHVLSDAERPGQRATIKYNRQRTHMVFAVTRAGRQSLMVAACADRKMVSIPIDDNVVAFDIHETEGLGGLEWSIAALVDSFDRPSELVRFTWRGNEPIERQALTNYNEARDSISRSSIAVENYTYTAADGMSIPGWLMYNTENGMEAKGTVLSIHGGPHLAYGDTYQFDFRYLCSLGYKVVFCNPRGSSGYGQAFSNAIVGEWGGKDASDVLGFLEHVQSEAALEGPLYVMGGSYGGYLVNWLIGHDHRFRAAISERSICNLHSKISNSDLGFSINLVELGGVDIWEDEAFIMERSPIRYAREVDTPVLLIHAEQDHRCPIEQSEQWFTVLKRLGKKVEFLRFPGASHGLASSGRPKQRIARLNAIKKWLELHE